MSPTLGYGLKPRRTMTGRAALWLSVTTSLFGIFAGALLEDMAYEIPFGARGRWYVDLLTSLGLPAHPRWLLYSIVPVPIWLLVIPSVAFILMAFALGLSRKDRMLLHSATVMFIVLILANVLFFFIRLCCMMQDLGHLRDKAPLTS